MTITRTHRWRIAFVLGGAAMAAGGPMHPDANAEDSLREELATMTAGDTWVLSHSLIAVGTALLAAGMWAALRNRSWPERTLRALRIATVAMSLYVVETCFHLASVIDSDALAAGDAAPIAFTHIGLALVLYPISGITFAWLNASVFRAVALPDKLFGVVGVIAGLLHAASVPLTIVFPDAEITPVFASAGMLLAVWSLGLGICGLRPKHRDSVASAVAVSAVQANLGSTPVGPTGGSSAREQAYRQAERALWTSLGATPSERTIELSRLGVRVRVQELGEGEPVLHVHGGPTAGTNWAPLAAQLQGLRSIIVDRPGSGLSAPAGVTAANLDTFAEAFVVDLLDALGLDHAHVVASSFGGFLALRAAAVAPHRFDRMVQMSCPAGAPGMQVPSFMRACAVPALRRLITALPPSERAGRSMLRQIGHGASVEAGRFTPEFMAWYLSLQRDTPTMANDMRLIGSLVTRSGGVQPVLALGDDLLGRVEVPTYFYWGADDPFGGAAVAQRTVSAMPDAQLALIPGAGHLPWLDDPAHAARAVEQFLLEARSASASMSSAAWTAPSAPTQRA